MLVNNQRQKGRKGPYALTALIISSEVPDDSVRLSSNGRLDCSCLSGGTSYI